MIHPNPQRFKTQVRQATQDPELRSTMRNNLRHIRRSRDAAFATIAEGKHLQAIGNAIKDETLTRLPELLEELEANLKRRGIRVHWALDAAEANAIILDLCQRHGVQSVIKGKSMVSEEIELNAFLGRHGIEALETDLGEFLVQLDGSTPSHIIAPAIHMNRHQVRRLLARELGEDVGDDIPAMTALARRVLREKFRQAGMGVTGVNFAVANTGTLCLVENEGNGRFCSTAPPLHVALMGFEKVLARIEDLPTMIRLLTRSATGQTISTYFNWISSPRRPGERDGPQEVHLIILDNGRSRVYADPELRETLACIRCGACLNICPVYARIGGHSYDSVYMGPIGKILTPQLAGLEQGGHLSTASTLCGACEEVCPVGIPIPRLLLRLRQEMNQPTAAGQALFRQVGVTQGGTRSEGTAAESATARWNDAWQGAGKRGEALVWKAWAQIHRHPTAYRTVTRAAGWVGVELPASLGPLKKWAEGRALPKPARKTLHERLSDRPQA